LRQVADSQACGGSNRSRSRSDKRQERSASISVRHSASDQGAACRSGAKFRPERKSPGIETDGAEAFFADLRDACAMCEVPDELPDLQNSLVNYAAPGVREILGYA